MVCELRMISGNRVHPGGRKLPVYRARDNIRVLTENDTLDGGSVIPGGIDCRFLTVDPAVKF